MPCKPIPVNIYEFNTYLMEEIPLIDSKTSGSCPVGIGHYIVDLLEPRQGTCQQGHCQLPSRMHWEMDLKGTKLSFELLFDRMFGTNAVLVWIYT